MLCHVAEFSIFIGFRSFRIHPENCWHNIGYVMLFTPLRLFGVFGVLARTKHLNGTVMTKRKRTLSTLLPLRMEYIVVHVFVTIPSSTAPPNLIHSLGSLAKWPADAEAHHYPLNCVCSHRTLVRSTIIGMRLVARPSAQTYR